MCQSCWSKMGMPRIDNARVRRAAALVARLYEEQPVGGRWHIVTDDWNLEDDHVAWCVASPADDLPTSVDAELGQLLTAMTEAERGSALGLWNRFWQPNGA